MDVTFLYNKYIFDQRFIFKIMLYSNHSIFNIFTKRLLCMFLLNHLTYSSSNHSIKLMIFEHFYPVNLLLPFHQPKVIKNVSFARMISCFFLSLLSSLAFVSFTVVKPFKGYKYIHPYIHMKNTRNIHVPECKNNLCHDKK